MVFCDLHWTPLVANRLRSMWKASLDRKHYLSRRREPHQQVDDCTVLRVSSIDELCNDDRSHKRKRGKKKHFLRQIPRESLGAAWENISSSHFWSSLNQRELPDIIDQRRLSSLLISLNEPDRLRWSYSIPNDDLRHFYYLITYCAEHCNQPNSIEVQGESANQRRLNQSFAKTNRSRHTDFFRHANVLFCI